MDERFNGGGITADAAVEALSREPWYAYMYRYGDGFTVPHHLLEGPKVLLINEANGSAAETFALMFKERRAGTIVGGVPVAVESAARCSISGSSTGGASSSRTERPTTHGSAAGTSRTTEWSRMSMCRSHTPTRSRGAIRS